MESLVVARLFSGTASSVSVSSGTRWRWRSAPPARLELLALRRILQTHLEAVTVRKLQAESTTLSWLVQSRIGVELVGLPGVRARVLSVRTWPSTQQEPQPT